MYFCSSGLIFCLHLYPTRVTSVLLTFSRCSHLRHDVLRERERDVGTVALRVAPGLDVRPLI